MPPRRRSTCSYATLLFIGSLALQNIAALRAEDAASAPLAEAPRMLQPADHGIGRLVPDTPFTDLEGHALMLSDAMSPVALVLAWIHPTCPLSNKFGPELARLEREFGSQGVAFLVVAAPGAVDGEIREFIRRHRLASRVALDSTGTLAGVLGATTTTEVFVMDRARTLRYRGAINDQYGLGYNKPAATRTYLRDALAALLARKPIAIAATTAPGCALDVRAVTPVAGASPLTYHHQISRIIQQNCVECHHAGGLAPFTLESYAAVIEHAGMIKKQVSRGAMPPWFATAIDHAASPWINDRSLTPQDKSDLLAWLASDRAIGNPADAPVPRTFNRDWTIGQPDVVFKIPKPVAVQAEGFMPYQFQVIATNFPEDRWVQGYEIRPSARAVVHHVIVSMHPAGTAVVKRGEGSGGFWAAYVPGNSWRNYPDEFARKLPAGGKFGIQIHYTPNGTALDEQLEIGLVFSKHPPKYEMHAMGIPQVRLRIPPGEANHVETATYLVPHDLMVTGYQAHSHLRGKAYKFEELKADGSAETLLDLPRYDFNWQLQYNYIEPRRIPAGSRIKVTAVFDNSRANPANPDPDKLVRWGPQTFDEMMIGYVEYYTPIGAAGAQDSPADAFALLTGPNAEGPAAQVAGTWTVTLAKPISRRAPRITIEQDGETLAGRYEGALASMPINGAVRGRMLQFGLKLKNAAGSIDVTFVGSLEGNQIKGTAQFGPLGESEFTAEKI